ncbi:TPA: cation efflux system protein CusF [Citrobacter braakii]|uniref:Copper-binding protein n=1 Tax=Citrobacter murliniae TaxID=67829 RepID=A0ABY2PYA7_9ENTR|nr:MULTISPECIES: cation efflux system protein CusF [Citrobacter]MCQ7059378.1 cation efflux system protein CusF [Escherichia coli]HEB0852876.1 cation efflux system protein CusF [Citrobacter freundii]KLV63050.1 periplasmic copper-binding protein [Citrobacter sp. MGH106]MBJ9596777.1 cation efflux system protein CusF [Citrobacter werkmanii]MBJ9871896.1 cation efflux system protein CusF [Citrobacter werkmanii]
MNITAKAALFSFLSVVMFNAQANEHQHGSMMNMEPTAQQEQTISATGVIESIDTENKKITIKHEPIPAVNWPAMTMRFTQVSDTRADDIKPGDKVAFTFVQQGNLSVLRDIHISK